MSRPGLAPMMRMLSLTFALIIGLFLWGVTALLADGIYPLGAVGNQEKLIFFTPFVIFVAPLATFAALRGRRLASLWLLALAPALGLVNGLMAVGLLLGRQTASLVAGQETAVLAALWLGLMLIVLIGAIIRRRRLPATPESVDSPT